MTDNNRFSWARAVMKVKPGDTILEIGCGVGLAVTEIAQHLHRGKITAIDRSEKMIQKAVQRNGTFAKEGKAEFLTTDLLHFEVNDVLFNKIFCFNINIFWTQKTITKEASIIRSLLKKNGLLYIFYGPMVASGLNKIKEPLTQNLKNEKFTLDRTLYDDKLNCCCFEYRV